MNLIKTVVETVSETDAKPHYHLNVHEVGLGTIESILSGLDGVKVLFSTFRRANKKEVAVFHVYSMDDTLTHLTSRGQVSFYTHDVGGAKDVARRLPNCRSRS